MYAVETKHLAKTYGTKEVLSNLNLQVPKNSIFGFLGPNGAGKSTTMKILMNLVKKTSGSINILGQDITNESFEYKNKIGYLPQYQNFYPSMTVSQVLEFSKNFFKDTYDVKECLDIVGLKGKQEYKVKNLSGGEKQRLGIAQAYIGKPELLILDEPASALDPIGRHEILELMKKLKNECTVLYSTHILDDVQQVSDNVAILDRGSLIAQGPIETLLGGDDDITYQIEIRGDTKKLISELEKKKWIKNIHTKKVGEIINITLNVNDINIAEKELGSVIFKQKDIIVISYQQKKYNLEEIFIKLVNGKNE